jgi:TPR repeat protein
MCCDLGVLNRFGGREKDIIPNGREAARWFEKAVACDGLGFGLPSHQLADMYKTGDGVPQDYAEAAEALLIRSSTLQKCIETAWVCHRIT